MCGKTPFASRAGSRYASTVDVKGAGKNVDLRKQSLKNLQAAAIKPVGDDEEEEEDEGVEERVSIRSLDEKVAVGGKNFSESGLLCMRGKSRVDIQVKDKDNC